MKTINLNLTTPFNLYLIIISFFLSIQIGTSQTVESIKVTKTAGSYQYFGYVNGTYIKGDSYEGCNCWTRTDGEISIGRIGENQWYLFKRLGCPNLNTAPANLYVEFKNITGCDLSVVDGITNSTYDVVTKDIYVATSGQDSNLGTSTSPFKTIQKALDIAHPGTTIKVKAGTYKERLIWKTMGVQNKLITLTNSGNDKVIIDGSGTTTNPNQEAMIRIINKPWITISNIQIQNNYKSLAKGIHFSGSGSNIEISNCEIKNIGWKSTITTPIDHKTDQANGLLVVGTTLPSISNLKIDKNKIHNCITGFSESLTVVGNVENFEVSNNKVYNNTNIGIDIAGYYLWANRTNQNKPRNGKVIKNTVYNCYLKGIDTPAGIYIDGAENIIVERNHSYNNGAGFSIGCENRSQTTSGITLKENVAYKNYGPGLYLGSNASNSNVANSIFTRNLFYENNISESGSPEINLQYSKICDFSGNYIVLRDDRCTGVAIYKPYVVSNLTLTNNNFYRLETCTTERGDKVFYIEPGSSINPIPAEPSPIKKGKHNLQYYMGLLGL